MQKNVFCRSVVAHEDYNFSGHCGCSGLLLSIAANLIQTSIFITIIVIFIVTSVIVVIGTVIVRGWRSEGNVTAAITHDANVSMWYLSRCEVERSRLGKLF